MSSASFKRNLWRRMPNKRPTRRNCASIAGCLAAQGGYHLFTHEGGTDLNGLLNSTQLLLSQASQTMPSYAEGLISFLPLVVIFAIFYFLLIRPQKQKQQQHQQLLTNLKRGDKVITTGGMYGTIESVGENSFQLKIANQVKVKISKSAVAGFQQQSETSEEE